MTVKQLTQWISPKPCSERTVLRDKTHAIGKKSKRVRTAFTTSQLIALEARYKEQKYLTRDERGEIALRFGIGDKHIKVWFQNRRMKEKKTKVNNSKRPQSVPNSSFTDSGVSDLSDIDALLTEQNINESSAGQTCPDVYMLPDHLQYSQYQNINQYGQHIELIKTEMTDLREWNSGYYANNNFAISNQTASTNHYCQPQYNSTYDYTYGYSEMGQAASNLNFQCPNSTNTYYNLWDFV